MLLLIAHHHDVEARWLCQTLRNASRVPVAYLVPEALGLDYTISLKINSRERPEPTVIFCNPLSHLKTSVLSYAVNRLSYIDPIIWRQTNSSEKAYTASEMNAFFAAFIESLPCPVSNPIHNGSLCGDVGFVAQWAAWFGAGGLQADPLAINETGKVNERISKSPAGSLFRYMFNGKTILTPPAQQVLPSEQAIRSTLLRHGANETLEVLFLKEAATERLLYVSKTPSLSCYEDRYPAALIEQFRPSKL